VCGIVLLFLRDITIKNNSEECRLLGCDVMLLDTANFVRFEVSTAVTMKNGVFWDVTPCASFKN
jgi:hypothetical protein